MVWRRLPVSIRHRLWPHLLLIRSQPAPAQAGALVGTGAAVGAVPPGQHIALPPRGSAGLALARELHGWTPTDGHGRWIVVLAPIEWDFRRQRPHKLAEGLARLGYPILYVNQTVRLGSVGGAIRCVGPCQYVVELTAEVSIPPYDAVPDLAQADLIVDALADVRARLGIADAWVCVMLPFWTTVAESLRKRFGWPVWYDRMDHWSGFARVRSAYGAAEKDLLRQSDRVTATASALVADHPSAELVPNACDDLFLDLPAVPLPRQSVVGYVGAIAEWFDVSCVVAVARLPGVQVHLYGAVSADLDVGALRSFPNVVFHGEIPNSDVIDAMDRLDVCMLPFRIIPLTESTDPVKVYEYLARGRPVVATRLPELRRFEPLVEIADTPDQFARLVQSALDAGGSTAAVDERRAAVASHTWTQRARAIDSLLASSEPLVSVVVLNWNDAALTAACIASVHATRGYRALEVICVDNGSEPCDVEVLRRELARFPSTILVENDSNLGFAAGMNRGVAASTGDIVVLLNNDVLLAPGTVASLEAHLRDPRIGLIGPVTNWTGNEARVAFEPTTYGAFVHGAEERRISEAGSCFITWNVAFFCVAMRADTWRTVGPLDERFRTGMFEDDDYCRRVLAAGLQIRIVNDTFVYHVGEASFSKLRADGRYADLFAENRHAFEKKWADGWEAHQYGSPQWSPEPFGRRTPPRS